MEFVYIVGQSLLLMRKSLLQDVVFFDSKQLDKKRRMKYWEKFKRILEIAAHTAIKLPLAEKSETVFSFKHNVCIR